MRASENALPLVSQVDGAQVLVLMNGCGGGASWVDDDAGIQEVLLPLTTVVGVGVGVVCR